MIPEILASNSRFSGHWKNIEMLKRKEGTSISSDVIPHRSLGEAIVSFGGIFLPQSLRPYLERICLRKEIGEGEHWVNRGWEYIRNLPPGF